MRYRSRKECWFGRLYRAGEEAEFAPGTRVPESLFVPLTPGRPARMAELRRRARSLGIAPRRAWTAADLAAAIAAAPDSTPDGKGARHGQ